MATAQLSSYDHRDTTTMPTGDGVCIASAMFGAASGALAGVNLIGGTFEYAAVLVGTLGVVLGSVLAGTAGRYLLVPAWKTFCRGQN